MIDGMGRSQRLRAVIFGALLVVFVGFYIHRNIVTAGTYLGKGSSDFSHYHLAARAILEGRSPFEVHNFDYPPLTAIAALPTAPFEYPTARRLWFVVNHLALAGAAFLLWRGLGRDRIAGIVVAGVWSCCGTVGENLVLGQINPVLLLLVVVAMTAAAGGFVRPAAVALATGLKLWPGVLIAADAVTHKWRRLAIGVGAAAILVVAPSIWIWAALPPPHRPTSARYWLGTPAFLNLSAPATVLRVVSYPRDEGGIPKGWLAGNNPSDFEPSRAEAAMSLTTSVAVLGGGFVCLLIAARGRTVRHEPLVAALVALGVVASPIAWYHYQLIQFPGIAWLLTDSVRKKRAARTIVIGALCLALTWMARLDPVGLGIAAEMDPMTLTLRGAIAVVLGLVLFGLLVRSMVKNAPVTT
jgi:hypothetical protein